ncbi:aldo/keto reductase, partial [Pseudomonas aeruginosa]
EMVPWCEERSYHVRPNSPVGEAGSITPPPPLGETPAPHHASSAQVALAWVLVQGVIAIPKAVTSAHIRHNPPAADQE